MTALTDRLRRLLARRDSAATDLSLTPAERGARISEIDFKIDEELLERETETVLRTIRIGRLDR